MYQVKIRGVVGVGEVTRSQAEGVVENLPKVTENLEDTVEVAVVQDFLHLLEVLDREEGLQALEYHRR